MKFFKSICSIMLVLAVIFSMGVCTFASEDTYSITIPDGFKEYGSTRDVKTWMKTDFDVDNLVQISANVMKNTKEEKVNPNEANLTKFKEDIRNGFLQSQSGSNITSVNAEVMELGENDAIKVSIEAKYSALGNVYYYYYVFETQNYIHQFIIWGMEDISSFADGVVRTVEIHDEPVPLMLLNKTRARIIAGAITGALIGAVIALVIIFIKKTSDKKRVQTTYTAQPAVTLTPDYWSERTEKPESSTEDESTIKD